MLNSNSLDTALYNRCANKNITEKIVSYVRDVCEKNDLSYLKVAEELTRVVNTTPDIWHLEKFVKAVVARLDKEKYRTSNIVYVPNTIPFLADLEEKHIKVFAGDGIWLDTVWSYLLNECGMESSNCMALNHKIVSYMLEHKKESFDDYKELLKQQYSVNWDYIEEQAAKSLSEWNKIMEELSYGTDS